MSAFYCDGGWSFDTDTRGNPRSHRFPLRCVEAGRLGFFPGRHADTSPVQREKNGENRGRARQFFWEAPLRHQPVARGRRAAKPRDWRTA
jgi:hypothetical protein